MMATTDELDIKVVRAMNGYTVRIGRMEPELYIAHGTEAVLDLVAAAVRGLSPTGA